MGNGLEINYVASPTCAQFHRDNTFFRVIKGPIGSGKTSAGIMEILLRAMAQAPAPDGVRRSRWACIRNTFSELKTTTIQSFRAWLGPIAKITMSPPPIAVLSIADMGDGTSLEAIVYFVPLDSEEDSKKLLSLELTGAFLDEVVFIPEYVVEVLQGRVGRYPASRDGGPTWYGIWGTTNPGSVDHWLYKLSEKNLSNFKLYNQPSGLIIEEDSFSNQLKFYDNPNAENIRHLPPHYYSNLALGRDFDYIKVFLCGEWGEVRSGQPVFPEFQDSLHTAPNEILTNTTNIINVGVDVGIEYNTAVFTQYDVTGQLQIVDELLIPNISISKFINDILMPHIANNYPRNHIEFWLDPAAQARSASDGKAAIDLFKENGLNARCAVTNNWLIRKEAVVYFLRRMVDGKPGFLLSPSCKELRRALISGYKYEKVSSKGEEWLKDKPIKNRYSHVADALQYACMAYREARSKAHNRLVNFQNRKIYRPATRAGY